MGDEQSFGVYDMPSELLFTLDLKLTHANDFSAILRSSTQKIDKARKELKRRFRRIVKGTGSKRKEFCITPEGIEVFAVAFTDGASTVTAIVEGNNMWMRGFRTADGQIYEFDDKEEMQMLEGSINEKGKTREEGIIEDQKREKMDKKNKQRDKYELASSSKEHVVKENAPPRPKKYIKGSILLQHSSNYGDLVGKEPNELSRFQVGYSVMKNMVQDLAHFDRYNYSAKHKRAMAALIIFSAESLKNSYISRLILKSLNSRVGAQLQPLGYVGATHINGWASASRLILRSLHIAAKVWDFQEQALVKSKEFYADDCWTTDPNLAIKHIEFIKGDAFPGSKLAVEDRELVALSGCLHASVGVVVMGGINRVLEHHSNIPCAAQISLQACSLSTAVQIVEGELPILTKACDVFAYLTLKVGSKRGQKGG